MGGLDFKATPSAREAAAGSLAGATPPPALSLGSSFHYDLGRSLSVISVAMLSMVAAMFYNLFTGELVNAAVLQPKAQWDARPMSINGASIACCIVVALGRHHRARLWEVGMVLMPCVWNLWLAVMSLERLEAVVARDVETHDAVRLAYAMAGVLHSALLRDPRKKAALAAWALAVMLLGGVAALCLRLDDPTLVRLPLCNVCLPMLLGIAFTELSGLAHTDRLATKLGALDSELHARTGQLLEQSRTSAGLSARVEEQSRRAAELEAARRQALVEKAMSTALSLGRAAESQPSQPSSGGGGGRSSTATASETVEVVGGAMTAARWPGSPPVSPPPGPPSVRAPPASAASPPAPPRLLPPWPPSTSPREMEHSVLPSPPFSHP